MIHAALIALALASPVGDLMSEGDQYFEFDSRRFVGFCAQTPDTCVMLQLQATLNEPSCLRWTDPWVRTKDGRDVKFEIIESGTPGEVGYRFDLQTTEIVEADIIAHVKVTKECRA